MVIDTMFLINNNNIFVVIHQLMWGGGDGKLPQQDITRVQRLHLQFCHQVFSITTILRMLMTTMMTDMRMIVMITMNLTTLQIKQNQRDIGLEFLAQLGGDELQEILKEAGITNAVHRYEDHQFQGPGYSRWS